jgi:hypothetical protein
MNNFGKFENIAIRLIVHTDPIQLIEHVQTSYTVKKLYFPIETSTCSHSARRGQIQHWWNIKSTHAHWVKKVFRCIKPLAREDNQEVKFDLKSQHVVAWICRRDRHTLLGCFTTSILLQSRNTFQLFMIIHHTTGFDMCDQLFEMFTDYSF